MNILFFPNKYVSHTLIAICIIVSVIGFVHEPFRYLYAFHWNALSYGVFDFLMQSVLFQFLHGNLLHLFANSYFLYSAGPALEARMSRHQFLYFFASTTIFLVVALLIFSAPGTITIGISGFCSALLAYLCVDLYTIRHPQAQEMLILLIINIVIGLFAGISFVGHFFGAVWGVIWWFLLSKSGRFQK